MTHIVSTPGVLSGQPRIRDTRIGVANIRALLKDGYTPEQIHEMYGDALPLEAIAEVVTRTKRGRNNKQRAKSDERDIARRLGGKRHPADTGGCEDIEHPELCIQVKGGATVVTEIIRRGLAAAKASANYPAKLPVLAIVDRRGTRLQRYIVFDLDQWAAWHGYGVCDEHAD